MKRSCAIERHIAAEKERLSCRGEYAAALPAPSIVWRRYVAGDTLVAAESPLLDVIDPAEVFIDATIAESDLSRVKIGDHATVRWAGSNKPWKAVVKSVFGRSLPWPDRLLAVASVTPSKQEPRYFAIRRAPCGRWNDRSRSRRRGRRK